MLCSQEHLTVLQMGDVSLQACQKCIKECLGFKKKKIKMYILEKEVKSGRKLEAVSTSYYFLCHRHEVSCSSSAFAVTKQSPNGQQTQSSRGRLNTLQSCATDQSCGKRKLLSFPLLPPNLGVHMAYTHKGARATMERTSKTTHKQ